MNRKANGASIATIRKAIGIPQVALAGRLGIAKAYMSQIEHGARQPAADLLSRIADTLGVPLDAISYPIPEPEPEAVAS
jgi:transcriptional regulator with XRE-family HTH domain